MSLRVSLSWLRSAMLSETVWPMFGLVRRDDMPSLTYADLPKAGAIASSRFPEECDKGQQVCEDHGHCTEKLRCSALDCELGLKECRSLERWSFRDVARHTCHGATDLSPSEEILRAANSVHLDEAQQSKRSKGCARQLHAQTCIWMSSA